MPERYGLTRSYQLLRAAERFGVDPRIAIYQWEPAMQALVCGFDRLRREEEGRELAERIKASAGALRGGE